MGTGDSGMSFGTSTVTLTVAATATYYALPNETTMLLLRAPAANVGMTYVDLGRVTSSTSSMAVRPSENIWIDLSGLLRLKLIYKQGLSNDDFPKKISYIGTAGDTLLIDVITL